MTCETKSFPRNVTARSLWALVLEQAADRNEHETAWVHESGLWRRTAFWLHVTCGAKMLGRLDLD